MARDLFGEVSTPSVKLGSQAWYTVPLSIAAHVVVTALVIVLPLASSDLLPVPDVVIAFTAPPPMPDPPPPPAAAVASTTPRGTTTPAAVAPTNAPSSIEPESTVPPGVPVGGVPGGVGIGESIGAGLVNIPVPPAPPQVRTPAPVRPGGQVKYPTKVHHVAPIYPRLAQDARVDGLVILEAVIAADGRVQDVRVLRSKPLLDQAAVDAVRQWRFTPTLLNGIPVPVIMTVTVNFELTR